jgi:molecular chaperone DnaJ
MPPLQRGRQGDLRVVVNVTIPRKLSREQKRLLQQFAGTLSDSQTRNGDEGMVAKLRRLLAG